MLRSSSKIKIFGALVSLFVAPVCGASATQVTENTQFRVNVNDTLSVSITAPDNWATGDINQFLRNRILVSATTNNAAGLTASLSTKTVNNSLVNTRKSTFTIPSLASNVTETVSGFPVNRWGFSTDDDVAAPRANAEYEEVPTSDAPYPILETFAPGTASQNVYFGAKADATKASGTYRSTIVISVVTGVIDDEDPTDPGYNPIPPVNPGTDETPDDGEPTYNPSTNYTTYTTTTENNDDTTTTTTEVSKGDNRAQYANPQGVRTTTTVEEGSPLGIALATTAAVAGTTGFIFFIIAKRRKDDDEEEENAGGQQPPIQ